MILKFCHSVSGPQYYRLQSPYSTSATQSHFGYQQVHLQCSFHLHQFFLLHFILPQSLASQAFFWIKELNLCIAGSELEVDMRDVGTDTDF